MGRRINELENKVKIYEDSITTLNHLNTSLIKRTNNPQKESKKQIQEDFMYDDGVEGLEDLNVVTNDEPVVEDSQSISDDIYVPLESFESDYSISLDDVGGDEMSIRGIEKREAFSVQERAVIEDIKEKFRGDYHMTDKAESTFEQLRWRKK